LSVEGRQKRKKEIERLISQAEEGGEGGSQMYFFYAKGTLRGGEAAKSFFL